MQRAGGDEGVEQAGGLQEGNEERHLAHRGDGGVGVVSSKLNQRLLTCRVSRKCAEGIYHPRNLHAIRLARQIQLPDSG